MVPLMLFGLTTMKLVGMVFFVGFFVAAGIAIRFSDVPKVRKGFLAGFFAVLLVVAVASPVQPLPMIQWHKFSTPVPAEETLLQLRVVDSNGQELRYDERATLTVDGVYLHRLLDDIVEADPAEQQEIGVYLLERAHFHRDRVENPDPTRPFRFPPNFIYAKWSPKTLEGYDEFVNLRIYAVTMVTSDDGRRLIETREELVLDFALDGPSGDDVGSADATGLDQWAIGDGVATAVTPMRPMGVVA